MARVLDKHICAFVECIDWSERRENEFVKFVFFFLVPVFKKGNRFISDREECCGAS